MKKKLIISILTGFILINTFCLNNSMALGNMMEYGKDFLSGGDSWSNKIDEGALKEISSNIYNILLTIGVITAVIVAMIIGIKFMVSSIEEKAKIKESLMPFLIGCIVVFGSFAIWSSVVGFLNQAESSSSSSTPTTHIAFNQYKDSYHSGDWFEAAKAVSNTSTLGKNSDGLRALRSLATGALDWAARSYSPNPELVDIRNKLTNLIEEIDGKL